jgi:hypothetical protein
MGIEFRATLEIFVPHRLSLAIRVDSQQDKIRAAAKKCIGHGEQLLLGRTVNEAVDRKGLGRIGVTS